MADAKMGWNDGVLLVTLLYLSIDMIEYEWDNFATCKRPVHHWLLVSYSLVVVSRLVTIAGSVFSAADAPDFMLDLRQKNATLRVLMSIMWLVILPLFTCWSLLGTFWIWDVMKNSPDCLPGGAHLWFLGIWQALSYVWIAIHGGLGVVAWFLERRLRTAEGDLRQLEDPDLLSRWGQVSRLQSYTSAPALPGTSGEGGLSAADISSLPGLLTLDSKSEMLEEDCPICLTELQVGDSARQLVVCGHTFHRACVDLWLYRAACCPLCKDEVKVPQP